MKETKIPEGWERCKPSECARVWLKCTGMFGSNVEQKPNQTTAVLINGDWISEDSWPLLGIIPIRNAPPPEPIEFVIPEIITPFISGCYMRVPEGVKPGMKFRQVVEE